MHIFKRRLFIIPAQFFKCAKFRIRIQDSGEGKETVYQVWVKGDPGIFCDLLEEGAQFQIMVDVLEEEIANVKVGTGRDQVLCCLKFLGKIYFHLQTDLIIIFFLLIVPGDLFLCISQGIASDLQKFGMFADPGDIFCGHFLAVAVSLLYEVCGVF